MALAASQCDYHMHSTASDGALSPTELLHLAADKGVQELALTDHDTFAGLQEARAVARTLELTLLEGMEFSCAWKGITIHLVTLWPQGLTETAREVAVIQEKARWQRAEKIIEKLSKARIQLELDEVVEAAGGRVPGRPHFARSLVERGYVKDQGQAFRKLLGAGKLGDVKNHWLEIDEAVPLLKDAGGWCILAHPLRYKLTRSKRVRLVQAFAAAGGQGVEVVSGRQDQNQTASMLKLAEELNLLPSWGSDFHAPGPACPFPGCFARIPAACQPLSEVFA
ncbi:PHP domain-containing protein [Marinospirillum perlucidum]|uniref:PHP domain-containing protein n=1 Tax=Marinospirillum perlucidum TaxID=1982602 RepID=UPI000DF3551F|nr:PHP domain-containing protein [Marinospirillum perlucidum]